MLPPQEQDEGAQDPAEVSLPSRVDTDDERGPANGVSIEVTSETSAATLAQLLGVLRESDTAAQTELPGESMAPPVVGSADVAEDTAEEPAETEAPSPPDDTPTAAPAESQTTSAAAPETSVEQPTPSARPPRRPHVLTGSFRSADNATRLRERILQLEIRVPVRVQVRRLPAGTRYRVLVGPFEDVDEAARVRAQLDEALDTHPIVLMSR